MNTVRKITVVISTYYVPFPQVVNSINEFTAAADALAFINDESKKWWDEQGGERSLVECGGEPYQPLQNLIDTVLLTMWGGEAGFHAMIDAGSYAVLHEAHYAREFDAKGLTRPGYLINAYVAGGKPGGLTEDEQKTYTAQQEAGLAAIRTRRSNDEIADWIEAHM